MKSHKLSSVVLAVFAAIVLVAPSASSTDQRQHHDQLGIAPGHSQLADGGAPVPPYPPKPPLVALTADGGAPVPPYPPNPSSALTADGGAPVPPYPPNPPYPPQFVFPATDSVNSHPTLVADGGAPVPPYPPIPPAANFLVA